MPTYANLDSRLLSVTYRVVQKKQQNKRLNLSIVLATEQRQLLATKLRTPGTKKCHFQVLNASVEFPKCEPRHARGATRTRPLVPHSQRQ